MRFVKRIYSTSFFILLICSIFSFLTVRAYATICSEDYGGAGIGVINWGTNFKGGDYIQGAYYCPNNYAPDNWYGFVQGNFYCCPAGYWGGPFWSTCRANPWSGSIELRQCSATEICSEEYVKQGSQDNPCIPMASKYMTCSCDQEGVGGQYTCNINEDQNIAQNKPSNQSFNRSCDQTHACSNKLTIDAGTLCTNAYACGGTNANGACPVFGGQPISTTIEPDVCTRAFSTLTTSIKDNVNCNGGSCCVAPGTTQADPCNSLADGASCTFNACNDSANKGKLVSAIPGDKTGSGLDKTGQYCLGTNNYCCKPAVSGGSPTPTPDLSKTDCEKVGDTCVTEPTTTPGVPPPDDSTARKNACKLNNQGDPMNKNCNPDTNGGSNGYTCCVKSGSPTPGGTTPTGTGGTGGTGGGNNPTPTPSCGTDTQFKDGTCQSSCNGNQYPDATCTSSGQTCCQPTYKGFIGHLDATTTTFSGWACQPFNNWKSLIKVNFYTDANKTNLLGSITANQDSNKDPNVPPSAAECGGTDNPNSSNHSFSFNPKTLSNWNPNNIPSNIYAFGINAVNGTEEPFTSNPATLSSSGGGGGTGSPTPTGTNGGPTATGGPVPTPNLTPEPALASVSLQVDSIDAIDAATQKVPFNKKRHLTLYLYTDKTYQTDPLGKKATYKATGDIYFTTGDPNTPSTYGTYVNAQFPLGTIPSGNYYIFGQTEGSLREPLTDTPQQTLINNGTINILIFSQKLPMGLLHIGQPYNTISVLDFNDIVTCYGDKMSSGDCVNLGLNDDIFTSVPFADFDMDGVVDGTDYNIWARNAGRTGL